VATIQLQDVLGLDGAARMNVPGLVDERYWSWRLAPELAQRLREATAEAGRLDAGRRQRRGPL
jgi:4-alpha-glucanotransferase